MKSLRYWQGLFFWLFLLLQVSSDAMPDPQNLSLVKQSLETYYDSGSYLKALTAEYQMAYRYLNQRVQANNRSATKQKLAIVFDIDETLLSNYAHMKVDNFGGSLDLLNQELLAADDPAIVPALKFYDYALKNKVTVFLVTGRPEFLRHATEKNLQQAGYGSFAKLYMKPNNVKYKSAIDFKSIVRQQIEAEGYDIVLSIGDQNSDLQGGYSDKVIKLSNPYYLIP